MKGRLSFRMCLLEIVHFKGLETWNVWRSSDNLYFESDPQKFTWLYSLQLRSSCIQLVQCAAEGLLWSAPPTRSAIAFLRSLTDSWKRTRGGGGDRREKSWVKERKGKKTSLWRCSQGQVQLHNRKKVLQMQLNTQIKTHTHQNYGNHEYTEYWSNTNSETATVIKSEKLRYDSQLSFTRIASLSILKTWVGTVAIETHGVQ